MTIAAKPVDFLNSQHHYQSAILIGTMLQPEDTDWNLKPFLLEDFWLFPDQDLFDALTSIQNVSAKGLQPTISAVMVDLSARFPGQEEEWHEKLQGYYERAPHAPNAAVIQAEYVKRSHRNSANFEAVARMQALLEDRVGDDPNNLSLEMFGIVSDLVRAGLHNRQTDYDLHGLVELWRKEQRQKFETYGDGTIAPMRFPDSWRIEDDMHNPAIMFEIGEMGVLTGQSGQGKSLAVFNIAVELAQYHHVGHFMLEISPESLSKRLMSYATGLPMNAYREKGREDAYDMGKYVERNIERELKKVPRENYVAHFEPGASIKAIERFVAMQADYAKRKFGQEGRCAVIIDYANAVGRTGMKAPDERQIFTMMANSFKEMAELYRVFILLVVQQNSKGDVLGSGDWRRRAQFVMKLHGRVITQNDLLWSRPAKEGYTQYFVCEKHGVISLPRPGKEYLYKTEQECPHCVAEGLVPSTKQNKGYMRPAYLHRAGKTAATVWAELDKANDGEKGGLFPLILNYHHMRMEFWYKSMMPDPER